MKKSFYLLLFLITLLGFGLRFNNYDLIPGPRESDDEFHYSWGGWTWLRTGIPTSWSFNESYKDKQIVTVWNAKFPLVTPMLDKPPLYYFLSGLVMIIGGAKSFADATPQLIRILPLDLSFFTILLTGILAGMVFSPTVGLISTLLFAISPTAVLAHRLNLTENLLTPLMLLSQIIFLNIRSVILNSFQDLKTLRISRTGSVMLKLVQHDKMKLFFLAIIAGLAVLTKQTGIVVFLSIALLLVSKKQFNNLTIFTIIFFLFFLIYPLIGVIYDWKLFLNIQSEWRRIGIQGGLPELMYTFLGRPLITTEKWFPDGTILLGYVLLFSAPLWLNSVRAASVKFFAARLFEGRMFEPGKFRSQKNFIRADLVNIFLTFPFTYITLLVLTLTGAEKIGSGQAVWGWYFFPLFPYALSLVAYFLSQLWNRISTDNLILNSYFLIITSFFLGSSAIRFLLLNFPRSFHYRWQQLMILLVGIGLTTFFVNKQLRKIVLLTLFIAFIGVNLYASLHLSQIYP